MIILDCWFQETTVGMAEKKRSSISCFSWVFCIGGHSTWYKSNWVILESLIIISFLLKSWKRQIQNHSNGIVYKPIKYTYLLWQQYPQITIPILRRRRFICLWKYIICFTNSANYILFPSGNINQDRKFIRFSERQYIEATRIKKDYEFIV